MKIAKRLLMATAKSKEENDFVLRLSKEVTWVWVSNNSRTRINHGVVRYANPSKIAKRAVVRHLPSRADIFEDEHGRAIRGKGGRAATE